VTYQFLRDEPVASHGPEPALPAEELA